MLMRTFVQDIFHFICDCVLCYEEQGGVARLVGGCRDDFMCAEGVVLTPRPSGGPVGAEDLTERADCHLICTPDLRPVTAALSVCALPERERERERFSTRNIMKIKSVCMAI